ncbi:Uncharacterised protein [Actinobacillus pleuropneumoniae]|nr:Uncharacterised protein [Actinobacillus pleuropneumoniae]
MTLDGHDSILALIPRFKGRQGLFIYRLYSFVPNPLFEKSATMENDEADLWLKLFKGVKA